MSPIDALDSNRLYTRTDQALIASINTQVDEQVSFIDCHQRAAAGLQFGMAMPGHGYNIFALGQSGSGMLDAVRQMVVRDAEAKPTPNDLCYVNNFQKPEQPVLLSLAPGQGLQFKQNVDQLIEDLRSIIPAAFDSEDYQAKLGELEHEIGSRQADALEGLGKEAQQRGIGMMQTPGGYGFAPLNKKGEVISPEDYNRLPEKEQNDIQESIGALQEKLKKTLRQFPQWHKELRDQVKQLNSETARIAVNNSVSSLKDKYQACDSVRQYLDEVERDVIDNFDDFRPTGDSNPLLQLQNGGRQSLQRFAVNVLVDQTGKTCAPVVHESLPTHGNLIGCIEHTAQMGTLTTNFTLIKAGALHRANGGYLLLDARQLLMQPLAYDSLKRALQENELRIESLESRFGLISTVSLEPQAAPLDIKVVLVGDRRLYYLLSAYDPEFPDLFKVTADFDDDVERNDANRAMLINTIEKLIRKENLLPFDVSGLARVIDQTSRIAGDAEKITTRMRNIGELVRESSHWAASNARQTVTASDVQQAIDQQQFRADRIRERMHEQFANGVVLIDTDGECIGQVNGLSVLQLGTLSFGQPARITATVRLGSGNVVDIERETELGGPIHSKGVLILSSFLGARYAQDHPLSISASLVFEQSYGGVEGDSASMAELCALLSVLSQVPIQQRFAMTGSVNQRGQMQAIGGVNEKIEGFFDVCRARGEVNGQAVIIPAANVRHLMLRDDVVQHAEQGLFKVFAVEHVDEALELLTGIEAGQPDANNLYPADSVNGRVQARLRELAEARARFASRVQGNDRVQSNEQPG